MVFFLLNIEVALSNRKVMTVFFHICTKHIKASYYLENIFKSAVAIATDPVVKPKKQT